MIKIQIALVIIALFTGCASKPEQQTVPCKGSNCKTADLLDNTNSKEEWYCYGKKSGGDWYCGNQADDTQIVAIATRAILAVKKSNVHEAEHLAETEAAVTSDIEVMPKLTVKQIDHSLPANSIGTLSVLDEYPRDAYTLQVIATRDIEKLRQYIEQNEIADHIIAHTLSQGSQWYVLLIGVYSGYSEAKNASLEWTIKHPKHTAPWIRNMGSLKDVLIAPEEV